MLKLILVFKDRSVSQEASNNGSGSISGESKSDRDIDDTLDTNHNNAEEPSSYLYERLYIY
jgi:hypothetical protein